MIYSTKDKGDIGLSQVIADLNFNNIKVSLPISEHLPFDLIAIDENMKLSRVSVKFRSMKNGCIEIPLRTISSNSKGYKVKICDLNKIDAYAIFCPENKKVYYINSLQLRGYANSMCLNIESPKNNSFTNFAENFTNPNIIFPSLLSVSN